MNDKYLYHLRDKLLFQLKRPLLRPYDLFFWLPHLKLFRLYISQFLTLKV